MFKRPMYGAAIAVLVTLASPMASAAGWVAILKNSPVEDFNDEDLRLYLDAVKQVLYAPASPQPLEWQNTASGASGTLLVVGHPQLKNQGECRQVRITVHSRKRQGGPSLFTACRQADAGWMLIGTN
ncbi:RT0821/Lpp0805 family surface protein [Pelomonas aquatica]|jgi:surface antigen|uniref:Surface antigen domain-containing protein n=1 Tax=Pelomonas aquatica TaxID=431058 RepID=A0A9X4LKU8_9BURK|nr:RT0821/Lpp0805 family surface protein [Pelomonas aquatica]MCY4755734.1 RT0821/Lpp0805 family surface protein [Pelomonas aquatica]MDG0862720.1 hypothetical protein [Pelomonas aquatica]